MESEASLRRVVAGHELAEQLDIKGTPTLVVKGWLLDRPPDVAQLDRMIKALLADEDPVRSACSRKADAQPDQK